MVNLENYNDIQYVTKKYNCGFFVCDRSENHETCSVLNRTKPIILPCLINGLSNVMSTHILGSQLLALTKL